MSPSKSVTLASLLHRFFVDYLPRQRALSPHTLFSYRDSIKLLLQFFVKKHGDISKLAVEDLTVAHITVFLQHLEIERSNCIGTRNVRLSAIPVRFGRDPDCSASSRSKRHLKPTGPRAAEPNVQYRGSRQ